MTGEFTLTPGDLAEAIVLLAKGARLGDSRFYYVAWTDENDETKTTGQEERYYLFHDAIERADELQRINDSYAGRSLIVVKTRDIGRIIYRARKRGQKGARS